MSHDLISKYNYTTTHVDLIHTEYTIYRNINSSVSHKHVTIYRETLYTWNDSSID